MDYEKEGFMQIAKLVKNKRIDYTLNSVLLSDVLSSQNRDNNSLFKSPYQNIGNFNNYNLQMNQSFSPRRLKIEAEKDNLFKSHTTNYKNKSSFDIKEHISEKYNSSNNIDELDASMNKSKTQRSPAIVS